MVAREKDKPETGKSERELIEREDGVQQIPPQQSVMPAPEDGPQSSTSSPDKLIDADDCAPLMTALGITNRDFVKGLFGQLLRASERGPNQIDGDEVFCTIAVVKAIKPVDELDAMQVVQMAAVHAAAMRASGEAARAEDLPHQESATRALIQLARTYSAQLEARKRYRSGEQTVTVQNVSVTEGGQAIVGNVTQGTPTTPPQDRKKAAPASSDAGQPEIEVIGHSEPAPVPQSAKRKA